MLSVGKISAGRGGYYLEAVAQGREDYYTQAGEVPGRWLGAGADSLGLSGAVMDAAFVAVLAGVDPQSGAALGRANRRVSAFDLTLSAPKSVSLLWALGQERSSDAVVAAHEAAVDAALGWLERTAVWSRAGHNGVEEISGDGLVAAAFRHRTSRAGDPQLHTHVVVANATRCSDGAWRTLDARWIYAHARTAGFLYQAELRHQLTVTLGVRWGEVERGVAELNGIDRRAVRAFSRRQVQIEAAAGPKASMARRRTAALTTRPAKPTDSFESLMTDWRERASDLGVNVDNVTATSSLTPQQPRSSRVQALTVAVDSERGSDPVFDSDLLDRDLCEEQAVFSRRDVLRQVAQGARAGVTVLDVERLADRYLAGRSVVALHEDRFGVRYTTLAQLQLEQDVVAAAVAGIGQGAGWCAAANDDHAPAGLADEQRAMVDAITRNGDAVSVVVGVAGSGKTFALRLAVDRWKANGYRPAGCALAARTAQALGEEARIPSTTIDRLLGELERGSWVPNARTVLIADEAAMVGTRKLARLVDACGNAGAKLVLVGDHRQLPEIEAGGTFVALVEALPAVGLTENRRQRDPADRQSLGQLRDGNVRAAVAGLDGLRRVHRFSDAGDAKRQLVADWLDVHLRGDQVLMTALHRQDVEDLNSIARRRLAETGLLDGPELHVEGRSFAVGDRVVALRNRHDLNLLNGDAGTVSALDLQRSKLTVTLDRGGERTIPYDYLAGEHLAHGYAVTVHKSQGMKGKRSLLGSYARHACEQVGEIELYPHAVPVAPYDARADGRLLVVSDEHPVARLRVERGVIGPRAGADPGLDHEISADSIGVVTKVVVLGRHGIERTWLPSSPVGRIVDRSAEVCPDPIEQRGGGRRQDDSPVRCVESRQEGKAILDEVVAIGGEDARASGERRTLAGETVVVAIGDFEHREPPETPVLVTLLGGLGEPLVRHGVHAHPHDQEAGDDRLIAKYEG